ncbi:Lrp/AsnC family transcriptional regulator [Mesorhizobium carmichaelinearum]|uniref:Lrp/AsnC family transcriptional regulator n=1 Tax=Mesorhizobium carmichaelinearum TaxID=1208188 RepID=UPI0015C81661|nr:Lrp/AsnC family transcriptional regulator [Mesorhizobium carmichaelinearum]
MTQLTGLDRTDFALMALLQEDAWLSTKELAASVGLAPSSVHERLKRLRSIGVLHGAHAHIDSAKVGFEVEALLMIEMAKHDRDLVDEVLHKLSAIPEVRSVYVISGRFDLVVHVVAKNIRALKDLALDRLTRGMGISKIETSIIFESRRHWGLPIPSE